MSGAPYNGRSNSCETMWDDNATWASPAGHYSEGINRMLPENENAPDEDEDEDEADDEDELAHELEDDAADDLDDLDDLDDEDIIDDDFDEDDDEDDEAVAGGPPS